MQNTQIYWGLTIFALLCISNKSKAQFWKRKVQQPDSVNICNLLISGNVFDSANNEYLSNGSITIMGCNKSAEISRYYGEFKLLTDLMNEPLWVDSFVYVITTLNKEGKIERYQIKKNIQRLTDRDCKRRSFINYQRLVVNIPPKTTKPKRKLKLRKKHIYVYPD